MKPVRGDFRLQELLRITAQQVAQVCDTLEQTGDTSRLARFLWSLPTDERSSDAFDRHESVLRARAVVAFHAGQFQQLYHILTTYRSVPPAVPHPDHVQVCSTSCTTS